MKNVRGGGFTLAELLIVMAIIVVLAAIAVPTFGKQLETARESNDAEAIRAVVTDAFTEAYMDFMKDGTVTDSTTYPKSAGTTVAFKQTKADFNYLTPTFTVGATTLEGTKTPTFTEGAALGSKAVTVFFEPDTTNGSIKLKDIKIDGTSIVATSTPTTPANP